MRAHHHDCARQKIARIFERRYSTPAFKNSLKLLAAGGYPVNCFTSIHLIFNVGRRDVNFGKYLQEWTGSFGKIQKYIYYVLNTLFKAKSHNLRECTGLCHNDLCTPVNYTTALTGTVHKISCRGERSEGSVVRAHSLCEFKSHNSFEHVIHVPHKHSHRGGTS